VTNESKPHDSEPDVIAEVDELSEQVKTLALNLALFLAKLKSKADSDRFARLEPEFIRLVNGTVRAIQDITVVLNAARDREGMLWQVPSGKSNKDQIEVKLHGILEQCNRVLFSLSQAKDLIA
jgi:hypothetical protein